MKQGDILMTRMPHPGAASQPGATSAVRRSTARRVLFAVPVLGWIARDLLEGDEDNIWYLLGAFVSLWIMAGMAWGLPGIVLPALALVPLCALGIMLITWD